MEIYGNSLLPYDISFVSVEYQQTTSKESRFYVPYNEESGVDSVLKLSSPFLLRSFSPLGIARGGQV